MVDDALRYRAINPARRLRLSGVAAAKTIIDLQLLARRRLPGFVYEYIEGGADAEVTLRRNTAVFENFRWLPKIAIDTALGEYVDLATRGAGRHAMVIAPMVSVACPGCAATGRWPRRRLLWAYPRRRVQLP